MGEDLKQTRNLDQLIGGANLLAVSQNLKLDTLWLMI